MGRHDDRQAKPSSILSIFLPREGNRTHFFPRRLFHRGRRLSSLQPATANEGCHAGRGSQGGNKHFSHFGPEANLFERTRKRVPRVLGNRHRQNPALCARRGRSRKFGVPPGEFTEWERLPGRYRPAVLRGPARRGPSTERGRRRALRGTSRSAWCRSPTSSGFRNMHRDKAKRAAIRPRRSPTPFCAACRITSTTFARSSANTDINFQRVPIVDTSNPFIARWIPTADESMVVIRFANPRGIDFPTC